MQALYAVQFFNHSLNAVQNNVKGITAGHEKIKMIKTLQDVFKEQNNPIYVVWNGALRVI